MGNIVGIPSSPAVSLSSLLIPEEVGGGGNESNLEGIETVASQSWCSSLHVWRLADDGSDHPIHFPKIESLDENSCYLAVHIWKEGKNGATKNKKSSSTQKADKNLARIFNQLAASSMTPRGLASPLIASDKPVCVALSKDCSLDLTFALYVWNGNQASPLTRAGSLARGYQLEKLFRSQKTLLGRLFVNCQLASSETILANFEKTESKAEDGIKVENDLVQALFPQGRSSGDVVSSGALLFGAGGKGSTSVANLFGTLRDRGSNAPASRLLLGDSKPSSEVTPVSSSRKRKSSSPTASTDESSAPHDQEQQEENHQDEPRCLAKSTVCTSSSERRKSNRDEKPRSSRKRPSKRGGSSVMSSSLSKSDHPRRSGVSSIKASTSASGISESGRGSKHRSSSSSSSKSRSGSKRRVRMAVDSNSSSSSRSRRRHHHHHHHHSTENKRKKMAAARSKSIPAVKKLALPGLRRLATSNSNIDSEVDPEGGRGGQSAQGQGSSTLNGEDEEAGVAALGSARSRLKVFDPLCSEITPRLFLGSDTVARNRELLKECGITHVLNCAGVVCDNYYESDFSYKMLHLLDGKTEDIRVILLSVLDWMDQAFESDPDHRVYVHCQQGVSRSSTMLIAYLMWKREEGYGTVSDYVKERRNVSSPNAGFMAQLMAWWNFRNKPVADRKGLLYRVVPHRKEDPHMVALRPCTQDFRLDPRFPFILTDVDRLYLWYDPDRVHSRLLEEAKKYVARLVRFENFPDKLETVLYEKESADFEACLQEAAQAESNNSSDQDYQVGAVCHVPLYADDAELVPLMDKPPPKLAKLQFRMPDDVDEENDKNGGKPPAAAGESVSKMKNGKNSSSSPSTKSSHKKSNEGKQVSKSSSKKKLKSKSSK